MTPSPSHPSSTEGIDKDILRAKLNALAAHINNLAPGYSCVPGSHDGNFHKLLEAHGRVVGSAWRNFEETFCDPLSQKNQLLRNQLAWWPDELRNLLRSREDAELEAEGRIRDEFREIARKDVEAELGSLGDGASANPHLDRMVATAEDSLNSETSTKGNSGETPVPASLPGLDKVHDIERLLANLREKATGDPEGIIIRKPTSTKWWVLFAFVMVLGFGELLVGVRVSTGTRAAAFGVSLLVVGVFNFLTLLAAERFGHVLSYWSALLTQQRRRRRSLPVLIPPESPILSVYVSGIGGTLLLVAALFLLGAYRGAIVSGNEMFAGDTLGVWLTICAVSVSYLTELAVSSPYPDHFAQQEDSLLVDLEEERSHLLSTNEDGFNPKASDGNFQTVDRMLVGSIAERTEVCDLDTPVGRGRAYRTAIENYRQSVELAEQSIRNACTRIQAAIVTQLSLQREYEACWRDVLEPTFTAQANLLVDRISSRDPLVQLLPINKDRNPSGYLRCREILERFCPQNLRAQRLEFHTPAMKVTPDGTLMRPEGDMTLGEAINVFESWKVPSRPRYHEFYPLYQAIRAAIRRDVLAEQSILTRIKHGVGVEVPISEQSNFYDGAVSFEPQAQLHPLGQHPALSSITGPDTGSENDNAD